MVRLAGLRRLHPVVPDRTAFGTAVERQSNGDHAENQCQTPEHVTHPARPYHTAPSRAFSSRAGRVSRPAGYILKQPQATSEEKSAFMPQQQQAAEFDIAEARRVLGDVFA